MRCYINSKNMYRFLYHLFDGVTPIYEDCGSICSAACCKGDNKTGMLLFPNEQTTLNVIEKNGVRLAVCSGSCQREDRPLSCRIFPFFPAVDNNGELIVSVDSRAFNVCPLARNHNEVRFSPLFIRHVKIAGQIMIKDPECRKFIEEISKEIEDINLAQKMLIE